MDRAAAGIALPQRPLQQADRESRDAFHLGASQHQPGLFVGKIIVRVHHAGSSGPKPTGRGLKVTRGLAEQDIRIEAALVQFLPHQDAVGDLSLAGMTIVGRFMGMCSGHGLNNQLLRRLLAQEDAWFLTTLSGAEEYWTWTKGAVTSAE